MGIFVSEYILRHPSQLIKSAYYFFFQMPWFPEFMFTVNDFKVSKLSALLYIFNCQRWKNCLPKLVPSDVMIITGKNTELSDFSSVVYIYTKWNISIYHLWDSQLLLYFWQAFRYIHPFNLHLYSVLLHLSSQLVTFYLCPCHGTHLVPGELLLA